MLRARCRAAQCVLDLTRRRSGGSGTAAVRVLADSSRQAPTAAGWIVIEHAPFHSAGATATAGAAAPVPAEGDSVQLGAENPEASEALGNSASSLEESELPTESQVSCGAKRCWFYQIGQTLCWAARQRVIACLFTDSGAKGLNDLMSVSWCKS